MGGWSPSRPTRLILQVALAAVVVALLVLPAVVVALSGTASVDALWTSLRIAALEGFTLVFLSITGGSFRSFFGRTLGARFAHRLHVSAGVAGFSTAVAHGACALVFGSGGYHSGAVWVGPFVLWLLAVVIATALLRARLRRLWHRVHRLNYLIFAVVLVHGVVLGSDLWREPVLKVLLVTYAVVALAGLVKRSFEWTTRAGGSRSR